MCDENASKSLKYIKYVDHVSDINVAISRVGKRVCVYIYFSLRIYLDRQSLSFDISYPLLIVIRAMLSSAVRQIV